VDDPSTLSAGSIGMVRYLIQFQATPAFFHRHSSPCGLTVPIL